MTMIRSSQTQLRTSLCLVTLCTSMTLGTQVQAQDATRIYDGEPAKTCEWPNTVHFVGVCSGTLVHPRVVLFAAHCKLSKEEVVFGENYKNAHGKTVKAKYCHKNAKFKNFAQGEDYAYCLLEEEVTNVPIAPIAYGCELEQVKAGAEIWLVGFGTIKNKTAGTKHKGKSRIRKLTANNTEIVVGGDDVATTCYGDSGGPAFIQLSDKSWRTIGIVSYGTNKSCEYPSGLTLPNVAVPWIHADLKKNGVDDIDLTPCYDDDGTWNPSDRCTKFPLDHGHSTADWSSMCSEGAKLSGPSTICAPKDEEAPTLEWSKIKDGDSAPEGEPITIEVSAKDNSPLDPQVTLWANDKKLSTISEPPYRWTLEDPEPGTLKLRALAEDAANNQTEIELELEIEKAPEPEPDPSEEQASETDSDSGDPENSEENQDSQEDDSDSDPDSGASNEEQEEEEESENQAQEQDKKGGSGCAIQGPGALGWLPLAFAALGARRVRRRRS